MNKSIQTIIVDDEPLAHKVILEYVKNIGFLEIVGQFYQATEALSFMDRHKVELIFLDINMPKIKGLDMLKMIDNRPMVIITSAYEEYALESFDLNVCDYLLKPFRFERFLLATNRAREILSLKQNATSSELVQNELPQVADHLFLKVDKRTVRVNIDEIRFLESYGNFVKVWIDENYLLTASTMTKLQDELPGTLFFRIHKSFMINKNFIDYIEGNLVVVQGGKKLPIGKSQKALFKMWL